jgi:hypothetical protein
MDEQRKPEPDHGASLVWSDDDERNVATLIAKFGGDVNEALKRFFTSGGGTDYSYARILSVRFASRFGMTEVDFMRAYRQWRKGKL